MNTRAPDNPNILVPFAPTSKRQPEANMASDDSGRSIIALLQKASEIAKEDCARAMDVAHKLSFQLRAAEDRVREAEAEVAHLRERATRAEAWLQRIHNEAEQLFFQRNEPEPRQAKVPRIIDPNDERRRVGHP
jgi:chromosome segregation ATPase